MTTDPLGTLAFFNLGASEIAVIVFLVFLLFGAAKIPALMRSLGRAQGEFQKAKREFEKEVKAGEVGAKPTAAPFPAPAMDLDTVRREAEGLGIATEGKDIETLRREVDETKARQASM